MQVEDEKHISTSLNKTSSPVHSSQTTPSRRGVVIVLCAVAIWSTTPVFIDQLHYCLSTHSTTDKHLARFVSDRFSGALSSCAPSRCLQAQRREIG